LTVPVQLGGSQLGPELTRPQLAPHELVMVTVGVGVRIRARVRVRINDKFRVSVRVGFALYRLLTMQLIAWKDLSLK